MNAAACPLRYSELLPSSIQDPAADQAADQAAAAAAEAAAEAAPADLLRYNTPEAIYARYITARATWYAQLPRGGLKTNQEYRRAKELPLRYSKRDYDWCLRLQNMKKCKDGGASWSKEEMMAYLDWSNAEDERVEEIVRNDVEANGFRAGRGLAKLWADVDRDLEEQEQDRT